MHQVGGDHSVAWAVSISTLYFYFLLIWHWYHLFLYSDRTFLLGFICLTLLVFKMYVYNIKTGGIIAFVSIIVQIFGVHRRGINTNAFKTHYRLSVEVALCLAGCLWPCNFDPTILYFLFRYFHETSVLLQRLTRN